jgi:Zn-dependent protease
MLTANRVGSALALTLAAFYSLCSLLFVVWQQGFMTATAALFHGFELSPTPHAMSFWNFISGVLCIAILGYLVGAVYAVLWNALSADRSTPASVAPARE